MQPENPQDSQPENSVNPPGTERQTPEQPTPNQVISPSPTPSVPTSSQYPAQAPQDNHKIIQDFGSPAFPTLVPEAQVQPKKSQKKLILAIALVLIVLFGGGAAAYFGYVVPNKPENIWKSALVNTGKGYDQLVEYSDKTEKIKDWTQSGSFIVKGDVAADGTFEGKSSGDTGQFTGSVSASGLKLGFDVRTLPSATSTPDIYIKADGLQGIGTLLGAESPELTATLNGINNQWYVIDHTLFDQLGASTNDMSFTNEDVTAFIKTAGATTKKYVFTDDPAQSIVKMKEKIGKETRDGRSVYHYKVSLDKSNTKIYLTALCDDFKASKLAKLYDAESYKCSEFAKDADNIKESDTADAWVDTKTKLVQAVRLTETKNKDNYVEVSQNYTGGDVMPFKLVYNAKEDGETLNTTIDATLNNKTNQVKLSGTFSGETGGAKSSGTFKVAVQPSKTDVKVEKPASAKTIIELANDLGLGSLLSGGTSPGIEDGGAGQINDDLTSDVLLLFKTPSANRSS